MYKAKAGSIIDLLPGVASKTTLINMLIITVIQKIPVFWCLFLKKITAIYFNRDDTLNTQLRDFSGGPWAKIPSSQCRRSGSDP